MHPPNWSRCAGIALAALLSLGGTAKANWNGSVSTDWNNPTNWDSGVVPNGTDTNGNVGAGIFSTPANIATISSDVTAMPAEIVIGGFGTVGRVDHVAGTLNTTNVGWPPGWMLVGFGGTGNATYNLADTATTGGALTGYGTGSGTLNLADALFMGDPSGDTNGTGVSTVNVNTTGALNVHWDMVIGTSGWLANVNVDAGTVHANNFTLGKIENSKTNAATGNLNISGGSVIANYQMLLSEAGANNTATVNQTGGTVSLGQASDGGWAGLSLASATGSGNGGTATYNLNGGTLTTHNVQSYNSGTNTKGTSILNFNGGTLKALNDASVPWDEFIGNNAITHAYVKAGGAIIDTTTNSVLVGQGLEGDSVSTNGGLTVNGTGTLTLAGTNTYTGNTVVNSGALVLDSPSSMKFAIGANTVSSKITGIGSLTLDGTFSFDLIGAAIANGNHWTLVDNGFSSLVYNSGFNVSGFTDVAGTWTMVSGNNDWTFSQSTGVLGLSVVPEPGTYALTIMGLLGVVVMIRRRRQAV